MSDGSFHPGGRREPADRRTRTAAAGSRRGTLNGERGPSTPSPGGSNAAGILDLSIVVVTYNSCRYLPGLLTSLSDDRFYVDGHEGTREVLLIDNASRAEDHRELSRIADRFGARLLRNSENVGYALANDQGFHVARGRYHLVINPDARVVSGCLHALIQASAAHGDRVLAGPLAAMDESGLVLMPPNELLDPYNESLTALSKVHPGLARFNMRRRTREAHRYWTATSELRMEMLSGACFLGHRALIADLGLFDPGYPLYFEDTDLFRRYHEAGIPLLHVPEARLLHFFQRSSLTRLKASLYRNEIGAKRYFSRHFGPAGLRTYRTNRHRYETAGRAHESPLALTAVPPGRDPPTIQVPPVDGVYLEVSGNPQFTLTVGIFPEPGKAFTFPGTFWSPLGPTSYWCRAVDPKTYETLVAWLLTKT